MAFTRNKHLNYLLVIGVLVAIIILDRSCGVDKICPKVTSDTITIVQTVRDTFHVKSPVIIKTVRFADTITLSRTDTLRIVETFLDTTFYGQTFEDENLTAIVSGTVTRNQLIDLGLTYEFNKSTTTITNTIEKPRFKLFAGVSINGGINSFGAGPSLAILTKGDHLYTLSNDVFGMQPNLSAGVFWKISLRRKP